MAVPFWVVGRGGDHRYSCLREHDPQSGSRKRVRLPLGVLWTPAIQERLQHALPECQLLCRRRLPAARADPSLWAAAFEDLHTQALGFLCLTPSRAQGSCAVLPDACRHALDFWQHTAYHKQGCLHCDVAQALPFLRPAAAQSHGTPIGHKARSWCLRLSMPSY